MEAGRYAEGESGVRRIIGVLVAVIGVGLVLWGFFVVGPSVIPSKDELQPVPAGKQVHDSHEPALIYVSDGQASGCVGSPGTSMSGKSSFTRDGTTYRAVLQLTEMGQEYECDGEGAILVPGTGLEIVKLVGCVLGGAAVIVAGALLAFWKKSMRFRWE